MTVQQAQRIGDLTSIAFKKGRDARVVMLAAREGGFQPYRFENALEKLRGLTAILNEIENS